MFRTDSSVTERVGDAPAHNPMWNLFRSAVAWAVLFGSLAVTFLAWQMTSSAVNVTEDQRFKVLVDASNKAISDRMVDYEVALNSAAGFVSASSRVDRAEWKSFAASLDLQDNFPGIQGLGYAAKVSPADKAALTASIRAEGFPDFAIKPGGKRDPYTAIIYLEPFDWRNQRAFGFDMYSEPTRRAAMQSATNTGAATVSGPVTLVQETGNDVQRGFLMYVPSYTQGVPLDTVEQRQSALAGWVYAVFRTEDLMRGVLPVEAQALSTDIYYGTDTAVRDLLYRSSEAAPLANESEFVGKAVTQLPIGDRTWTTVFGTYEPLGGGSDQPLIVAVAGLTISALLFLVVGSLSSGRQRAKSYAAKVNHDLSERADELARSNRELERFTSIASHDLKEPLRQITCSVELLEEGTADLDLETETREWMQEITAGTLRMRELVDGLWAYAQVNSDQGATHTMVDTGELVAEALASLAPQVSESGAVVDVVAIPPVYGDARQLASVFQNVIMNAIAYRSEEPLRVRIDAELTGTTATFSVVDNGIGIEPAHREQIFQMFQRLHLQGDKPGTGIGLAISQRIVEKHGGRMWVDSNPDGQGSNFRFTLPTTKP